MKISIRNVPPRGDIFHFSQFHLISLDVHPVGFEPTPPKRTELESVALDHSATDACNDVMTDR